VCAFISYVYLLVLLNSERVCKHIKAYTLHKLQLTYVYRQPAAKCSSRTVSVCYWLKFICTIQKNSYVCV